MGMGYRPDLLGNRVARSYRESKNLPREHCVQHATVQFRTDAAATPFRATILKWRAAITAEFLASWVVAPTLRAAHQLTSGTTIRTPFITMPGIAATARCVKPLAAHQRS